MPTIRPVTELMAMSMIGIMTSFYESSTSSMNDNVREIWETEVHDSTIVKESVRKSVMMAIALARGLTIHIYIASYVLMLYPILFERGLTLLLLWMLLCAIRSVIVNLLAMVTGCFICSNHSDLKPVCFEFSTMKAIELACSVYMWLSVNDFHVRLRTKRRSLIARRMLAKTTQINDSDLSLVSSDLSYVDFTDGLADSSEEAILAKSAVDWLAKTVFGNKGENRLVEADTVKAHKFLNMSADELKELQNRIKEKLYEDAGVDGRQQEQSTKAEAVGTDTQIDSEALAGSEAVDDNRLEQMLDESATMALAGGQNNNKKNEQLTTQSTGSQTKEPSRKLQERLSKEEMSPRGSKSFEPSRKPPNATGSKSSLAASKDGSQRRSVKSNSKDNNRPEEEQKGGSLSKDGGPPQGILIDPDDENRLSEKDEKPKKTVSLKKKQ